MQVSTLPGARFSCHSCGRCCQGWEVPVDEAVVANLRKHDWGGEPFERVRAGNYRVRLVDNRCFFLDRENRCRIHSEVSYDAKPAACRSFPLSVLQIHGRQFARLSFWCPSVIENAGKPLEHQVKWIRDTARQADQRIGTVTINGHIELATRDIDQLTKCLSRMLRESCLSVADSLAAASELIFRLNKVTGSQNAGVARVIAETTLEDPSILAAKARQRGHAPSGRRAMALYLLQDRREGRLRLACRLISVLSFFAGLTKLTARIAPAGAMLRTLRRTTFDPSEAERALLTRYIGSKLDSCRYLAGEATLTCGFNVLVAAYGIIDMLAKLRAAAEGRSRCSSEDIAAAVGAADLLVVEHSALHRSALHRRLSDLALDSPAFCGDLLRFLEER